MTTIQEQLDKLNPPSVVPEPDRTEARWKAMALILREMMLAQGVDLDQAFKEDHDTLDLS
jgi:hypothetical protein